MRKQLLKAKINHAIFRVIYDRTKRIYIITKEVSYKNQIEVNSFDDYLSCWYFLMDLVTGKEFA